MVFFFSSWWFSVAVSWLWIFEIYHFLFVSHVITHVRIIWKIYPARVNAMITPTWIKPLMTISSIATVPGNDLNIDAIIPKFVTNLVTHWHSGIHLSICIFKTRAPTRGRIIAFSLKINKWINALTNSSAVWKWWREKAESHHPCMEPAFWWLSRKEL